ncbi:MAG: GntR family transcriptional regulator [Hyphomicrobiales bacterium]|nr:GntR family transcriptional regulator [Hyphomicrobiales bacterium]
MSTAVVGSGLRIAPLARDTLQERVYTQMADLILDGEIAPGQSVTIQGLAESFDVSAMPVREALKRLTAANALTVVSGRSIGIPPLTLDRLTDLRNVRLEVEGTAIAWAAQNARDALVASLRQQLDRMEQGTATDDTKAYLRGNRAFHFAIYRSARSPTLNSLIEILWLQISPYFNLLRESGNYVSSNRHHRTMIEALAANDPVAAREAIAGDIEDSYAVLSAVLT